jgi:SAM-dependent methyltransferase
MAQPGSTHEATRERWASEIAARARAHWTPVRTAELARGKALLLPPAEAAPLLRALGILDHDAALPPAHVPKYFQINHMVALLGPELRALRDRHAVIRLVDAGCGRSYLTLLIAWCAREVWRHPLRVLGVDRNPAVIEESRRRCALAGLDDAVRFEAAALDAVGAVDVRAAWSRGFPGDAADIHGAIALHACDTATCDAIALGVALGAELIAVAPCCQAELARAWSAQAAEDSVAGARDGFAAIRGAPHLRRETAAHVTDAMRLLLLRAVGYDARAIEFVPAEHTRKNTLIVALRALQALPQAAADPDARAQYAALCAATGGPGLQLARRLEIA